MKSFFVYVLVCSDGTLYTGYTTSIEDRLEKHNLGLASKYTRARLPVKLVYSETAASKSLALQREKAIKNMSRAEKIALINKESGDRSQ